MVGIADATSVKMDYLPIGHARVDPILSDSCLSDHVHTFYGPQSGVDPRRIDSNDPLELHSRLVGTSVDELTGNVEENKSMYWHPTVYKYNRSTNTYTRDIMAQSSAYYVWDTGETKAFPNGFQMISGFDTAKSGAIAECVNEQPCDAGDCYTESTFFPATKCDELEVSMRMPECWDGVSINSPPGHTDHVAYANEEGDCPSSHPVKVPQIHLFFRIMPYDGGWHTFSDGSGVFHADYVSGWDENFLQNVLDNCENDGDGAMPNFFCEDMLTFRDAPKCTDENTCDFGDPNLIEKVRAFQPEPLDIAGTIVNEETAVVVGDLPRGTCNGSLVGGNNPTPTAPPVSSPTAPPTDGEGCLDDESFLLRGTEGKTCDWIGKVLRRKDRQCRKRVVKNACPETCGQCSTAPTPTAAPVQGECLDDESFLLRGTEGKTCDWIGKVLRRKNRQCRKRVVKNACRETCGLCPSEDCR